ncbi:uncharacterized protein DNG_09781 [Cephalotrichum gorgonifer]|uniref:Tyrosinase copper-binding domain-containing protein n=1 Tax=Cephalotrichum gorgonifer TaxID=2041049 RepID=A0AAE8N6H4_9PEZI|nr:uncharacterized protein DNG_09781 [Cephalotrichum gorgonifer]
MMLAKFALLLAGAAISAAQEEPSAAPACKTISQRRAWHTLSDEEKTAYIDAELCLMAKEPTLGLNATKNKFEELQSAHQSQANIVHGVGAFLPFHRLLMHAHETYLRELCGYEGTQPYWDETFEAGKFSTSPIFDTVVGFGGNGVGDEGCIADGPFAGYNNSLGPGYLITDHCITRFVSDATSMSAQQQYLDACYEKQTFVEAWPCIEGRPHGAGHGGVGGLMLDPIASPGDPIFYLHHTWLDKVFWDWQALDLPARLTDIGGGNMPAAFGGFPGGGGPPGGGGGGFPGGDGGGLPGGGGGFPGGGAFPGGGGGFPSFEAMQPPEWLVQVPEGDPGDETTLDHILNMFGIIPNATIGEVMDIAGGLLCYEYV